VDENGEVIYGDQLMIIYSREILSRKPDRRAPFIWLDERVRLHMIHCLRRLRNVVVEDCEHFTSPMNGPIRACATESRASR